MTLPIALLIGITLITLLFLAMEWLEADVVALGMMITLVLTGLLPAERAFKGFGSDTVIVILGLLILTAALLRTGVVDTAGRLILRHTGRNPTHLLFVIMLASATLGAFMSNTASTAFFVPIVFGLARRAQISPAKLLMPLAFSSILTGSVTLISTSTNVVVSGLMTEYKMPPMGMFELAPVGIPIMVVGLIYMMTLGRKLIPDRFAADPLKDTADQLRPYLSEIVIHTGSPLAGKTLAESALGRDLDLMVLRIVRNKDEYLAPASDTLLQDGDVIIVEGRSEEILKVKDIAGMDIKADVKLDEQNLDPKDLGLVEVILLPRSGLVGRTLKGFGFREHYGLQVIGISRHGETLYRKISTVPLRIGDILLLQGKRENINRLEGDQAVRVLGALNEERPKIRHAPVAIAIFLCVLALPTFTSMALPVAVMLGVVAVFVTRCISSDQAYCEVEWKAVILIAAMLSLGGAMEHTGTASYLAASISRLAGTAHPYLLLSGFFVLTVVLTQPMSNQAAAIVVLPVAIRTAYQLEMNPRTFAIMIAVAASCSYLTPLEPSCLMVYGPGRYRFADFLKVGAVLTVLIYTIAILLVPRYWPL